MTAAVAYVCGLLFAIGLAVPSMTHPTKVLDFLDFAGRWDPSLIFVMASAVLLNAVAFRLAARRGKPVLAASFSLSSKTAVDARLLTGAVFFGVGWGLGGFCPGPALVSVVGGAAPAVAFVVAMLAAMAAFDAIDARVRAPAGARLAAAVDPEV